MYLTTHWHWVSVTVSDCNFHLRFVITRVAENSPAQALGTSTDTFPVLPHAWCWICRGHTTIQKAEEAGRRRRKSSVTAVSTRKGLSSRNVLEPMIHPPGYLGIGCTRGRASSQPSVLGKLRTGPGGTALQSVSESSHMPSCLGHSASLALLLAPLLLCVWTGTGSRADHWLATQWSRWVRRGWDLLTQS